MMKFIKETLGNGLRIITIPMPSSESATITVWVRTGSRFEEKRINGISHFLEHMVFKGSKKRPSAKIISEELDSLGAEFNAGTSKEWTNFYIKARKGVLEKAFDILSDIVLNPILAREEIEREKGVILEENAMYEDTPLFKIGDFFENLIYKGSSLGWDIIGTPSTIKGIQRNDFIKYRDARYYSENMLVTVSGGVKPSEIRNISKTYFGYLKKVNIYPKKPKEVFVQKKPQSLLKSKKTDQTHIMLGFRGDALGTERRYAEAVLGAILGGGMSSRLFIEIRERRGLAYAIKTSSDHAIDNGYIATYAGIVTDKINLAIKEILKQHYGLSTKKYPISAKELQKAKEYIKGHLALSLEDTKDVNSFFGLEELLLNRVVAPEEVYKKIDQVAVDEVLDVAREFFIPERLNLAIIGPFKNASKFEKLLY